MTYGTRQPFTASAHKAAYAWKQLIMIANLLADLVHMVELLSKLTFIAIYFNNTNF